MNFHVLGLFPEVLNSLLEASLIGRAIKSQLISCQLHQLRNYATDAYRSVDDKVYGGGKGQVMRADIICNAVRDLKNNHSIEHVVLTSPRGRLFNAKVAQEWAQKKSVLFVCGRYEGVDQRAIDLVIDDEISVGDFVLTGGEWAAGLMIEATARFVPGVVSQSESVSNDSFSEGLLEHDQFTRPEIFEGLSVPPVLLSGDHSKIAQWKHQQSLKLTWQRRPDLFRGLKLNQKDRDFIQELIKNKTGFKL